jgi:hypothetical protein
MVGSFRRSLSLSVGMLLLTGSPMQVKQAV